MHSAREASKAILEACRENSDGLGLFRKYERRIYKAMKTYWELVEHFYTKPFMEVFLSPRHKLQLPAAVNATLAGELEGSWRLKWRLRVFFWIVKLQRRWPLVPTISFD